MSYPLQDFKDPHVPDGIESNMLDGTDTKVPGGIEPKVQGGINPNVSDGIDPKLQGGIDPKVPDGIDPDTPFTKVCPSAGCSVPLQGCTETSKMLRNVNMKKTVTTFCNICFDGGSTNECCRPNQANEKGAGTSCLGRCRLKKAEVGMMEDETEDKAVAVRDDFRESWSKKMDFLLSCIGFAVDLGNVWRFPYICYLNGGGAFLIPYLIMLVFIGVPLFYMELALGQYQRCGVINVWKRICPMFCGVGYGIIIINTLVGSYYNTIIGWSFYYLVSSFKAVVPWGLCNQTWNSRYCVSLMSGDHFSNTSVTSAAEYYLREVLEAHRSRGIEDLGDIKWSLTLCVFFTYIIIFLSIWRGIKGSGKVVWVTATLPYVVLLILLVRGCTLPGAGKGIEYFIKPNFSRLLSVQVWIDAAGQIFFSLGPGFGVLLALSSYNKFNNNCYRDAIIISAVNCLTSLLAGFVVFAVLGYMAELLHVSVDNVAEMAGGPGLVFIAYPEAIAAMAASHFWAVIFFIMLITLGLDSSFGGFESVMTGLLDQFPKLRERRSLVLAIQLSTCFLISLTTTTYGGQYVIKLLDDHSAPIALVFMCFIEVIAVNWIYVNMLLFLGVRRFSADIKSMLGFEPGLYWKVSWTVVCPLVLTVLFIMSIVGYPGMTLGKYTYPQWAVVTGWCISFASIACVPVFMIYWFSRSKGGFKQKMLYMIRPTELPTYPPVKRSISFENI